MEHGVSVPDHLDDRARDLGAALQHLSRSLRTEQLSLIYTPARCRQCGYPFDTYKLHTVGKCPRCEGTWISGPLISLEKNQ